MKNLIDLLGIKQKAFRLKKMHCVKVVGGR